MQSVVATLGNSPLPHLRGLEKVMLAVQHDLGDCNALGRVLFPHLNRHTRRNQHLPLMMPLSRGRACALQAGTNVTGMEVSSFASKAILPDHLEASMHHEHRSTMHKPACDQSKRLASQRHSL